MILRTTLIAAALIAAGSIPALADHGRIDQRQYKQERRIERGIARGDLTRHEANRLRHRNWEIEQMQRQAWRDGWLSPGERRSIEAAQDRLSRQIRRERHDGDYRYRRGYRGYDYGFGRDYGRNYYSR